MSGEQLKTAQYLTERSGGHTVADLCAAVSTTYYALFETLAKMTADLFVGPEDPNRTETAWRHVYRSLEHKSIANQCMKPAIQKFPQSITDFAEFFLQMQHKRELADYEYGHSPNIKSVQTDILRAELKITALIEAEEKHKRAFCVFILIDKNRHEAGPKALGKAKTAKKKPNAS